MQEFSWSDAWLFTALSVTHRPARLEDLIATADWINHAIPTTAELNHGLNRLHAAGLVEISSEALRPSPAGADLYEKISAGRRSILGIVDHIHRALRRDYTLQTIPERFAYTDAEVHTAYEAYRQHLA